MSEQQKPSIKSILIIGYILIGILVALYCWIFGDTAHKSFFYNLGLGLVWPAVLFPGLGKAIGVILLLLIIAAFTFS